ncbi:MAG: hypothetical protein WB820_14860 [Rhodoplanes sp.]
MGAALLLTEQDHAATIRFPARRSDRCLPASPPLRLPHHRQAQGQCRRQQSLLNKGLIKEIRAKRDDTVWRHDEERGRMTLVATNAAFAALGHRSAGSGGRC